MSKARREIIDRWVKANKPDGIGKLARESEIPTGSLSKIRAGRPLQNPLLRRSLARALGVKESELFPSDQGKSRAS
jgi:hypothetical protein